MKRKRLNLEFEPEVMAQLARLKEITLAASFTEIIRRALSFYCGLIKLKREGWGLVIQKKGEKDKSIIWF
jgi:hypothetical protein